MTPVDLLRTPVGEEALAAAAGLADTESPAAGSALRRRFGAELAAAALDQTALRRRARTKFGPSAATLWFTRAGLEQATRPRVAAHRAERYAAAMPPGARVADLGCGIGTDALALVAAGMSVIAVEVDPDTAAVARANLASVGAEVIGADAGDVVDSLLTEGTGVFVDPARRTARGRSWDAADVSPPWPDVLDWLRRAADGGALGCVKAGPGLPYRLIPAWTEAEWVSDDGDLVELALWAGPGCTPGLRSATLVGAGRPSGGDRLALPPGAADAPPVGAAGVRPVSVGDLLYEPDPAVIRAGAVDALAGRLGGDEGSVGRVHRDIAYLVGGGDEQRTPFATAFRVLEILPHKEKVLRAWVRDHRIGTLEIKKRGVTDDPARLRQRLRPAGPGRATLVLTPTPSGARVLVVDRVPRP